jgi:hypothetical protein
MYITLIASDIIIIEMSAVAAVAVYGDDEGHRKQPGNEYKRKLG